MTIWKGYYRIGNGYYGGEGYGTMGLSFYSVKMRASEQGKHISGAERLVLEREVDVCVEQMLGRGRNHSKGKADLLNIKMEKIEENEILYLDTLQP